MLLAPATGDIKASGVAQTHSQSLLRFYRALPVVSWMTYGWEPPSRDIWRGNYTDDLAQVTILP